MENKYYNIDEGKRLVLFDGMPNTPTDIDGCYDCHGKGWIFYESKCVETPEHYQARKERELSGKDTGQEICLRRLVEDTTKAGKKSIAIICEHDFPKDMTTPVILKDCKVRKYIFTGHKNWITPKTDVTVEELSVWFIDEIEGKHE